MKNKNAWASFAAAISGIRQVAQRERNFKFQIFCALAAITVCGFFHAYLSSLQIVAVGLSIFFVLTMELFNTAVEAVTDLCCGTTTHSLAKLAKDAAAGAVFLAAIQAAVVAVWVAITIIGQLL